MAMWYLSYDGKQIGPLDQAQASAQARQNPKGYARREGFTAWVPIPEIDELTSGVDFDIQQAGGIKTALFGGEGLFFASLRGPGRIWLQSLPFSRLAGRMLQAAPQKGGRREEGSILGSLGGLLDGDNRY